MENNKNKKGKLRTGFGLLEELSRARQESREMMHREGTTAEEYWELQVHANALEDEYAERFIIPRLKNRSERNINATLEEKMAQWDEFSCWDTVMDLTDKEWSESDKEEAKALAEHMKLEGSLLKSI